MLKSYRAIALSSALAFVIASGAAFAEEESHETVGDDVIAGQKSALHDAAAGKGFGPQSPRDISQKDGANPVEFGQAPPYSHMNLCNIHFHNGAEHRGGEFTTYNGNGDGHGFGSGFRYDGNLTAAELAPIDYAVGLEEHGKLQPGDTIEIHYVHSTADVQPGATLKACMNEAIGNPQLRVEAFVYVLVNDDNAADLGALNNVVQVDGKWQAPDMPTTAGDAVTYEGSTTGPTYNETGSPFEVTWDVHPKVVKVSISSVAKWLAGNEFKEDHAHGVRNLVDDPALLSKIE